MEQPAPPSADTSLSAPHAALLREAQQLTEQFLVHFYHHDARWCIRHCHSEASYLGTTRQGIALSYEQLREVLFDVLQNFNPSLVLSIDCEPRLLPGNTVLVLTQFHLVSDPIYGRVHTVGRRGTLIWVPTSQGLRLRHMHFSAPHSIESGASDISTATVDAYRYANAVVNQVVRGSSIPITDVNGTMHHIAPIEVRYLEADRQRCIIHCLDRTVVARRGFREMCTKLGDDLVVVHRSFAINLTYLRVVTREEVVMDDGTRIPLPQRRSREIRHELEELLMHQSIVPRDMFHGLTQPEDE